jgi:hypothetical protein
VCLLSGAGRPWTRTVFMTIMMSTEVSQRLVAELLTPRARVCRKAIWLACGVLTQHFAPIAAAFNPCVGCRMPVVLSCYLATQLTMT